MKFSQKKWFAAGALLLAVIVFAGFHQSKAQTTVIAACPEGIKVYGWAWSSNIGWISFNSDNPTGGGGPHCVSIKDDYLTGWAWSSNVGWIKFGGLSGFPSALSPVFGSPAGNAHISNAHGVGNDKIEGWARACAGTVKAGDNAANPQFPGDCSTMTPRQDGWDGWIELTGLNHTMAYSPAGAITGNAWGSDVIGEIGFNLTSTAGPAPAASCSISASALSGGKYKVEWISSNTSSCNPDTGSASFSTGSLISGSDENVYPSPGVNWYKLACVPTSGVGTAQCNTTVTLSSGPGCEPNCVGGPGGGDPNQPALQMWLNNHPGENLSSVTLRLGDPVKINWKKTTSATYSVCEGYVDGSIIGDGTFDTTEHPNGSAYIINPTLMTAGQHVFGMTCTPFGGSPVTARARSSGVTSLTIKIIDPALGEF